MHHSVSNEAMYAGSKLLGLLWLLTGKSQATRDIGSLLLDQAANHLDDCTNVSSDSQI